MICLKSSNCTLKQSKTNPPLGQHPDNLMPLARYKRRQNYLKNYCYLKPKTKSRTKAVSYRGLFFLGYKQSFLHSSYCPVRRENRVGSSWNESDYSGRGTQISFPLFESRSCENFGLLTAHFSIIQGSHRPTSFMRMKYRKRRTTSRKKL